MDELEAELEAIFETRSTDEWVTLLAEEAGLPVGPLYDVEEALENEQVTARGMIDSLEHSAAGEIPVIDHPLNYEHTDSGFDRAPPLLGEHTTEILERIGYDEETIDELRETGAVPDSDDTS